MRCISYDSFIECQVLHAGFLYDIPTAGIVYIHMCDVNYDITN